MQTFAVILLLAVIAFVGTNAGYRLRRWRLTAALASGGWFAVGTGAVLGPHVFGVVTPERILRATPLIVLGLGWIGLMLGLQMHRAVLRSLPRSVLRVCALDTVLTLAVFGALGWFGIRMWGRGPDEAVMLSVSLIACAAIGWTMETRSLAAGDEEVWREGAMMIRGAGGLAGVVAVAVFGVVTAFTVTGPNGAGGVSGSGATRIVVALALGVVSGLIGRFALREAGSDRGQVLAVLLGLVALVGGLAYELELSSLFVAGVAGAVMANLAGHEMRTFEMVILRAEHVVAAVFAMLAGVMLDPMVGWSGVGLAAVLAGTRLMVKRWVLRAGGAERGSGALAWAVVRQSPLAVALGVGVAVLVGDAGSQRLLTVVVLAGVMAEVTPLVVAWALRGSPMGTPVETGEGETPGGGAA